MDIGYNNDTGRLLHGGELAGEGGRALEQSGWTQVMLVDASHPYIYTYHSYICIISLHI